MPIPVARMKRKTERINVRTSVKMKCGSILIMIVCKHRIQQ